MKHLRTKTPRTKDSKSSMSGASGKSTQRKRQLSNSPSPDDEMDLDVNEPRQFKRVVRRADDRMRETTRVNDTSFLNYQPTPVGTDTNQYAGTLRIHRQNYKIGEYIFSAETTYVANRLSIVRLKSRNDVLVFMVADTYAQTPNRVLAYKDFVYAEKSLQKLLMNAFLHIVLTTSHAAPILPNTIVLETYPTLDEHFEIQLMSPQVSIPLLPWLQSA